MMEIFPNLVKVIDLKPQEAQKIPSVRNPKKPTARHIIIKMPKARESSKQQGKRSYLPTREHP